MLELLATAPPGLVVIEPEPCEFDVVVSVSFQLDELVLLPPEPLDDELLLSLSVVVLVDDDELDVLVLVTPLLSVPDSLEFELDVPLDDHWYVSV